MKARAYRFLRGAYKDNWAPSLEAFEPPAPVRPRVQALPKKMKLSGVAGMMQLMSSAEEEDVSRTCFAEPTETESVAAAERKQMKEVETYLRLPQVPAHCDDGSDFDLCMWWRSHSQTFPRLSIMARVHHALPASSAGVERLFSAAGRMHDDFKKNTSESTLESSLLVYKNT